MQATRSMFQRSGAHLLRCCRPTNVHMPELFVGTCISAGPVLCQHSNLLACTLPTPVKREGCQLHSRAVVKLQLSCSA